MARNKAQVELGRAAGPARRLADRPSTITEQEYDQRKANLDVAQAQLKAAEAGAAPAELNLDWTDVRAPIAGRISDRKVDAGNLIPGGQQGATLLATIVTLDPIRFVFDVSESDYLRYTRLCLSGALAVVARRHNPVRIRLADETDWTRTGKIDFVDNEINAALGHHPRPRHRRQQEPAPDAGHLRPRAALWRRRTTRC